MVSLKEYVRRVGADKFYADHIRFLYDVLKAKNKKVMMWGRYHYEISASVIRIAKGYHLFELEL